MKLCLPCVLHPVLLAALSVPTLASEVLTVGPAGAYPTIASAVAAAAEGDTLLVGPGVVADPGFAVMGKALSIVADQPETITVNGSVYIANLEAGQTVLLAGLRLDSTFTHASPDADAAISIDANIGAVRLQDCHITASGRTGVFIDGSDDVALVDCEVTATGHGLGSGFGSGIFTRGSIVALHGCVAQGPPGEPGSFLGGDGQAGGSGLGITSALVHASACTFTGGVGGEGGNCLLSTTGDGGPGGAGVMLLNGVLRYRDSTFMGGPGGQPGASVPSSCPEGQPGAAGPGLSGSFAVEFPGLHRVLHAPSPVRELVPFPFTLSGEPGELTAILWSPETAHTSASPQSWPLLVSLSPPAGLLMLGIIPPNGSLAMATTVPDLGAGVDSLRMFAQSIHQPSGGALTFGAPTAIVVLDASF